MESPAERDFLQALNASNAAVRPELLFQELSERLECVEGFLKPVEGFALYWLARHWPGAGKTVEIGSFKGRSTCWIATGCRDGGREKVIAVDHFQGSFEHQPGRVFQDSAIVASGSTLDAMRANLEQFGLTDWVTLRVGTSADVSRDWSEPIRLLFIDGDHSYEAVSADFAAWSPHVVPNGVVVFHDVGLWAGVTKLFEELAKKGQGWRVVGQRFTLGILERVNTTAAEAAPVEP